MSTQSTQLAAVKRPDSGDIQMAIHGLHSIFWALNMLVVHHAADDIAHEQDLKEGVDALIVAGKELTENMLERL